MPAKLITPATTTPASEAAAPAPRRSGAWSLPEVRWATLATVLFAAGLVAHFTHAPAALAWALFLASYATGGWEPGLAGLQALRERTLDVDLLMVLAAIGAAAIGQVLDGGLLIVIFATSGALEAVATHRTAQAVRSLLDLAPERATLVTGEGEEIVESAALRIGDVILVRPGERVGADGRVLDGSSDVDQATITGEPLPVTKNAGDEVFAGTLNGTGALRVRVERAASDTVVVRIVAMVEEASETKAKTQLFIEKVEQRYSLGMVTATLLLFAIPLLAGAAFQPTLLRAMTFMIVASPCAVVLATMPPLLAAMANAGRHGVLVKSAVVMEQLGSTTRVAFDKTGTLTEGTPRLAEIRILPGAELDEKDVLALAAAAENPSEHPLARAVVAAAHEAGLTLAQAQDFAAVPGRGVTARVSGHEIAIGGPKHLLDAGAPGNTAAEIADLEEGGQTAAVMRIDGKTVALLGIADRTRPAAATAVARITAVTGATPVLLTGDNARAAARLAGQLGIDDVRAGLLPQDKVDAVRGLEAQGARVLLVGDGVNDAPALAAAHTGVAMGRAGSDLALDTADAVIMRDDLATVPAVIILSRRARRVVTANLAIAATIITALVVWDLAGHLPLPLGVLGHEGSTVIVGLNGLRLLRKSAWRRALAVVRPCQRRGRLVGASGLAARRRHGPGPRAAVGPAVHQASASPAHRGALRARRGAEPGVSGTAPRPWYASRTSPIGPSPPSADVTPDTFCTVTDNGPAARWIVLLVKLPAEPSRHRVAVWRELRRVGALSLGHGVWAAPDVPVFAAGIARALELTEKACGEVISLQASGASADDGARFAAMFTAARQDDWSEFLADCGKYETELDKEIRTAKFTLAELEEEEQSLERLRRWHRDIKARDVFGAPQAAEATQRLQHCAERFADYTERVFAALHAPDPFVDGVS